MVGKSGSLERTQRRRLDDGSGELLAVLEGRWALRVLTVLSGGPQRFADLADAVPGVSRSMLTLRLRDLEAAGLVVRAVAAGPPISSTYALTAAGLRLCPPLEALWSWATSSAPRPRR